MSEIESGESAPDTSTTSIAESAYEQLESADAPSTETGDVVEAAAATPEKPTPGVVLSEEEQLLAEFGFKDVRKPDGREHWIPRSKVLKMIGSGLKRGQEKWTTERGTLEGQLKAHTEQWGKYGPVLELLDQGPETFLEAASAHDDRYKAFLTSRSAPVQAPAEIPFPEPDLDLGNGSKTYSIEGIKKLVAHATQVARAEANAAAAAALKPVTEREKQAQEQAKQAEAQTELQGKVRTQMSEAESWPLFGKLPANEADYNDVQKACLAELRSESEAAKAAGRRPTMTLAQAYIKVTSSRMAEDDKTKRAKLLAEVSKAAKASPSVQRSGGEVPAPIKGETTRDIAMRAYAKLENGA